ncbi:MAG: sugar phosphate nucleotidyltransferase [Chlorobi bacterium]|nr:sugar phosphate nucleotidyltransferase [Chlorobiota bacterium]
MITKAVIMAGGFGTRLRPLTMDLPKPMVPVANTPMMEHIVRLLKAHGVREIVAVLYFYPEVITSYFGDGSKWGVHIQYVTADADYGTAGSVKNAQALLGEERTLVISGDVLTDFDLSAAASFHQERNAQATLVLARAANPLPYGIVITDEHGKIERFLEKPSWGEVFSDTINTGIYILESSVLELIPSGKEYDFSKDLFPLMLQQGRALYGYTARGYWRDIGNLSEYQQAHYDVLAGNVRIEIDGERKGNLWIGNNCNIGQGVQFRGTVIIGDNTTIADNVVIDSCIIGRHCSIGYGSRLDRTVLWDNVHIGASTTLEADVVASGVEIGSYVSILENVFIAHRCRIADYATVGPNIKLWPDKYVEPHAIVQRSMIQEEKWSRELFTDARITGSSNVEMNPEFAARLGTAIGTALPVGATVIASRDADPTSRMIKRALVAGLLSAGVSVEDLQMTPIPQTRIATRSRQVAAGFHVRRSFRDPSMTDVVLIGSDGRDLSGELAKKIERYFLGEDIRRVPYARVGQLRYPERQQETYVADYLRALDISLIASRRFRILIDYSFGMAITIFPSILGSLGATALALNSYIDPYRASVTAVDEENRREISNIMRSLGYEIGFKIDPGAERIALIDDRGYWFSSMRLLTIVTKLFLESNRNQPPYAIAVPVEATSEVDMIAQEYGVEVIRTKNSHSAMMEATRNPHVRFVGGTRGGFIFSDYSVATDGLFTVGKILEMLARTRYHLSELDSILPKRHQARREVHCPWHKKGTVMRLAMEWSNQFPRQLIDGVKVFFPSGESVLIVPQSGQSWFNIVAEADTPETADRLATEVFALIEKWKTSV